MTTTMEKNGNIGHNEWSGACCFCGPRFFSSYPLLLTATTGRHSQGSPANYGKGRLDHLGGVVVAVTTKNG